jgi:hypothetical protein
MSEYAEYSVTLTENQKKQVNNALMRKQQLTLRLKNSQLSGTDKLLLTKRQVQKIEKHKIENQGVDIKLSDQQLQKNQQGGLLPLAALIPALAAVAKTVALPLAVSAGSAVATNLVNKAMSGSGSYSIPDRDINELIKIVTEMETKKILPSGSKMTADNYVSKQNGGFILPLFQALYSGKGLYMPWESKN